MLLDCRSLKVEHVPFAAADLCTVSIVETARVPEVTAAVARAYERSTGRRCPMFSSRPAGGAAAWRAT